MSEQASEPSTVRKKFTAWETGVFRIVLANGAEFTARGRIRFQVASDGLADYELDDNDVLLVPAFNEVLAVIRVNDLMDPKPNA